MLLNYYWPGGIPRYIKCDQAPLPWESIDGLTNGWRSFVKVSYFRALFWSFQLFLFCKLQPF